jgi:hypothetical protein
MKICYALIVFYLIVVSTNAQVLTTNDAPSNPSMTIKRDFKNAGEQEEYWAAELFKNSYKQQQYKKYNGTILNIKDGYCFKDVVLIVYKGNGFREIFEKGIFYPEVLHRAFDYGLKSKVRPSIDSGKYTTKDTDTPTTTAKAMFDFPKTDTLKITDFEELKFLETTPKQRRFRFWLFTQGFGNPTVYFIELTNKQATVKTSITEFIKGAELTFCKEGWLII